MTVGISSQPLLHLGRSPSSWPSFCPPGCCQRRCGPQSDPAGQGTHRAAAPRRGPKFRRRRRNSCRRDRARRQLSAQPPSSPGAQFRGDRWQGAPHRWIANSVRFCAQRKFRERIRKRDCGRRRSSRHSGDGAVRWRRRALEIAATSRASGHWRARLVARRRALRARSAGGPRHRRWHGQRPSPKLCCS